MNNLKENKVIVAVCSGSGLIPVSVVVALDRLELPPKSGKIFFGRQMIDQSRNDAAEFALAKGATHLMFIDDDQLFDADIVMRLLEANTDIACAPVVSRMGKDQLNLFDNDLKRTKDYDKVYACGMGLTLVKCTVLKELVDKFKYPFQFATYEHNGENKKISEDLMFCIRAQMADYNVKAVQGIKTGHIGDNIVYYYED